MAPYPMTSTGRPQIFRRARNKPISSYNIHALVYADCRYIEVGYYLYEQELTALE